MLEGVKNKKLILAVSIAIPLVVAILFGVKIPDVGPFYFLPPIYATINAITAFLLVWALVKIKKGKVEAHKRLVMTAMFFSLMFLVLYVVYHMTSNSTKYGGDGIVKIIYYFILITHIVLSIVVIPFVLITFSLGWNRMDDRHRKWAKIAFPLWLYVAVSGVLVYLMISPYYGL